MPEYRPPASIPATGVFLIGLGCIAVLLCLALEWQDALIAGTLGVALGCAGFLLIRQAIDRRGDYEALYEHARHLAHQLIAQPDSPLERSWAAEFESIASKLWMLSGPAPGRGSFFFIWWSEGD